MWSAKVLRSRGAVVTSIVDSSKQLAQLATMLESTAPPSLLLLSQVHLQRVPDGHLPGVPRHCDLAGPLVLDLGAHGLPGEPKTPAKNSLAHATCAALNCAGSNA